MPLPLVNKVFAIAGVVFPLILSLAAVTTQKAMARIDVSKSETFAFSEQTFDDSLFSIDTRVQNVFEPENDDLICLAKNLYFEARGEGVAGMEAVAHVTMNRVKSRKFPSTICGVVYQSNSRGCQFSWTCDGHSDSIRDRKAWDRSLDVAKRILASGIHALDPTYGATFYHTTSISPYWADSFTFVTTIGNHMFYRG